MSYVLPVYVVDPRLRSLHLFVNMFSFHLLVTIWANTREPKPVVLISLLLQ